MAVPPGGPIEICFSFDTTGSMSSSINAVKQNVQEMIQRLQTDIPGIRIAVFAHGDYCDRDSSYVTKYVDFSTDLNELCNWVKSVGSTGGGDSDECYELVLHQVQTLSWTPGTQRALVMIGDAHPHDVNYPDNKLKLDWKEEVEKLAVMGVRVYGVQCRASSDKRTNDFYQTLADKTAGRRVELEQFSNLFDFIMAICYREQGAEFLDIYEQEVRARDAGIGVHKDLNAMFGALKDDEPSTSSSSVEASSSKSRTLPYKPALKKLSSLTKAASITKLKKKSTSIHAVRKTIVKKTVPSAMDRKRAKHLAISCQKLNILRKLKRENVAETNFSMNRIHWSPWELVISPIKPEDDSVWTERHRGRKGFRKSTVCGGKTFPAAVYEFSVRKPSDSKRYVTYCKLSSGFTSTRCWESRLLSDSDVRSQVNKVVSLGYSVFVRRCLVTDSNKNTIKKSLLRYDYAWRKVRNVRDSHRNIQLMAASN
ncbi:uncharacterized protein LOC133179344 [Saccostrea echinata]|uniref:uncharacterized protein LOC133179344 n=1 Tax=Saccostrea echinata TaxID=191078 RepID=UPI002A81CD4B|nr:uncharacterized protein LOC133179344 [Saccostrea echinata]